MADFTLQPPPPPRYKDTPTPLSKCFCDYCNCSCICLIFPPYFETKSNGAIYQGTLFDYLLINLNVSPLK